MDTEEHAEIRKAQCDGRPETDEGPYYHESWWESYKGSIKGKLGGIVIGALIGAAVGLASVGVLATAGVTGVAGAVIAGFAAAGMLYGAHEFSDVGRVTGAVAAAHEKAEQRMKSFETGKFAELKREIRSLQSLLTRKPLPAEESAISGPDVDPATYRTSHSDGHEGNRKWIFWKVAAIGLAVGLAAGAMLAAGHVTEHLLSALGTAGKPLTDAGEYIASMTAMGLFGASFGINRDLFRHVFDKTDLWFNGILGENGKIRGQKIALAAEKTPLPEKSGEKASQTAIATVVYEGYIDYPQSDTFHREKLQEAQLNQLLLGYDHTKSLPN